MSKGTALLFAAAVSIVVLASQTVAGMGMTPVSLAPDTEHNEIVYSQHPMNTYTMNVTNGKIRVTVMPCLGKVNWTLTAPNGEIVDGLFFTADHVHRPVVTHAGSISSLNFDETVVDFSNLAAMNGIYTIKLYNIYQSGDASSGHHMGRRDMAMDMEDTGATVNIENASVTIYWSEEPQLNWPYPELPDDPYVDMEPSGTNSSQILLRWDASPNHGDDLEYCIYGHAMGSMMAHYIHATPCSMHIVESTGDIDRCVGQDLHVYIDGIPAGAMYMVDIVARYKSTGKATAYYGGVWTSEAESSPGSTASPDTQGSQGDDSKDVSLAIGITFLVTFLVVGVVAGVAIMMVRKRGQNEVGNKPYEMNVKGVTASA
ncbi:uncharacterized protein MONBRDRAFT_12431 [Monosiga brevicollis MX1]|uniref:Fibronectin type-III domain-containing protein n=1 Tax=Monosiga brevicollis TaxID=81824 RepID=A9VC92_MONBE|nr:uncharacterized protein MONBRDRAFT_12431 [Monosiga brevicollis MX1]EDQ84859.1 predicted protein [Monosiga brevicollis MX1]|eukprot:XP_001750360.1 hypothetical protein [Monosiga brevicollis MX1]